MSESRDPDLLDTTGLKRAELLQSAMQVVANLCDRHRINALDDFLQSSRTFAQEETLNIAVLGRFKAGKRSQGGIAGGLFKTRKLIWYNPTKAGVRPE